MKRIAALGLLLLSGMIFVPPAFGRSQARGVSRAVKSQRLKFRYEQFEGPAAYDCRQTLADELSQDWNVECLDELGAVKKRYRVHLWLTEYRRETEPRTSLELLYWVTDQSVPAESNGTGTTVWFHLKNQADLALIQVSQSVEKDTAGLYLEMVP